MAFSEFVLNIAKEHTQVFSITVFVAVIYLCLVIGHLLEENRRVNESITALLIGCISGTMILFISNGTSSHILGFNEELFFIYLLPPIIFNAGIQVKKKMFFQNFFTIMLFRVIGVFISSFIITVGCRWLFPRFGFFGLTASDYLAIGTIFSSTDTVCTLQVLHQDGTALLYSLVIGEGVVNDATSVVLFNAVQKLDASRLDGWAAVQVLGDFLYLFSTSTALVVSVGLLTAYVLKGLYLGSFLPWPEGALCLIAATAFCAEYLLFYFHSTSHKGLEGYYHLIIVLLIALCILSTVAGAFIPTSLPVDLCSGIAITLQGLWFYQTALTLYGPMMPDGCRLKGNEISCHSMEHEVRGELLANAQLFAIAFSVLVAAAVSYGFAASRFGHSDLSHLRSAEDGLDQD